MTTLCILGGTGFVGARAVKRLAAISGSELRVLEHRRPFSGGANVVTVRGDGGVSESLDRLLVKGAVVVNMAYAGDAAAEVHARALAAACERATAARLVHLSSCSVYGATRGRSIDEYATCTPRTVYERAKLAVERVFVERLPKATELVILRPTAIFGARGRNLESLALRVLRQGRVHRYLRASAMGRRRMHAVDVEAVVEATAMLAFLRLESHRETFIVSDDDQQDNNYRAIEDFFIERFSRPNYVVPPLRLPEGLLSVALRLTGRSDVDPQRQYSCEKLKAHGFVSPRTFRDALEEYAAWLLSSEAASR